MTHTLLLLALATDLFGPGARPLSRQQLLERPDGTGNVIEYAFFPSRSGTGFTTIRTYTTRREAGQVRRQLLLERDVQMPPENLRVARLPYVFGFGQNPPTPNRIAFVSGTNELSVRPFNPTTYAVGRAVLAPANLQAFALRPNSDEAWTLHSGAANQASITNLRTEAAAGQVLLRLANNALPVGIQFTRDGRRAWILVRQPESNTDRGLVVTVDCENRVVLSTVSLGVHLPTSVALSADESRLLILGTVPGSTVPGSTLPQEPSLLAFSTLANTFVSLAAGTTQLPQSVPAQLFLHPDGARAYWLNTATSNIEEFNLGSRQVARRIAVPRNSIQLAMDLSATGEIALVRDASGTLSYLLELGFGTVLDATQIPQGPGFLLPRF
ncbi:MAG: hypothetical protein OHK0021_09270 [Bryobacter sp.]